MRRLLDLIPGLRPFVGPVLAVVHAFVVFVQVLPLSLPISVRLNAFVAGYVAATNTQQWWQFFGPEPSSVDEYAEVDVVRGRVVMPVWSSPRYFELSPWQRWRYHRLARLVDNAITGDYPAEYWEICRYARNTFHSMQFLDSRYVLVELSRSSRDVVGIGEVRYREQDLCCLDPATAARRG